MLFRGFRVICLLCPAILTPVLGDPTDWVNVNYVLQSTSHSALTNDAQKSIGNRGLATRRDRPWSVANPQPAFPPSGDRRDYLSWAPYHWPNCDWCTKAGHANVVPPRDSNRLFDQLVEQQAKGRNIKRTRWTQPHMSIDVMRGFLREPSKTGSLTPSTASAPGPGRTGSVRISQISQTATVRLVPRAPVKSSKPSCTPSPTKELPPSATWTTCPYEARDGQVNPDVRSLIGPSTVLECFQHMVDNAISYASGGSKQASVEVIKAADDFFFNATTRMNPHMKFGQVVRGPGPSGVTGTFTGILDLRGLVGAVNAVEILRATQSPDWTSDRDNAFRSWISQYLRWMTESDIGKKTASRPNNHATFYNVQLASGHIALGNKTAGAAALSHFFGNAFLDQLAATGEQPFERARTRPFHYRCFNLEALIAGAKLGDELGLNLWTAKSRYGATIQTAVDFAMKVNPQSEDVKELVPHVAAAAAVYGDPQGTYMAFMKKNMEDYTTKPFWFYDQPEAIINSQASKHTKARSFRWTRGDVDVPQFQCPAAFKAAESLEIDNGIFVTCDDLRPFYNSVCTGDGSIAGNAIPYDGWCNSTVAAPQ